MIQTTSPPAASRKWLRISGGRIRLPASCCWRIPPRISQIESSTKPPPAVITQAINAAHFIYASLVLIGEREARSETVFIPPLCIYQPPAVGKVGDARTTVLGAPRTATLARGGA